MNAIFGQRQRLRRFASGMLLVWLFALTAGVVNACVVAPEIRQPAPVAAAPDQHDVGPGHHHVTAATGTLEFRIVFDTHGGELTDDLLQGATLTLADGRKLKPARWTGPGPGGYHRD